MWSDQKSGDHILKNVLVGTGLVFFSMSFLSACRFFQHVVFGVCRLIDLVVPDIPESLDVKIKRERYLAKEALQDADHVLQVNTF